MRNGLKDLKPNQEYTLVGKMTRLGFAEEYNQEEGYYYQPTILFLNLHDNEGNFVTDHLWVHYTEPFVELGELHEGDMVQFKGQVSQYKKGVGYNKKTDYEIVDIHDVQLVNSGDKSRSAVPDDRKALAGYVMERNRAFYEKAQRQIDEDYVLAYDQWLHPDEYTDVKNYEDETSADDGGLDADTLAKLKQFAQNNDLNDKG